jgi:hypothetical protein
VWHWDKFFSEYFGFLLSLSFNQRDLQTLHADTTDGTPSWQFTASLNKTPGENQYSETNVMHFLFSSLRIKGLYMFRALLAYPQETPVPLQSW